MTATEPSNPGVRRPVDLARRHGLSTQAVRNYERDGVLPPAQRSPAGYRQFTDRHARALSAYLALIAGHGYATAGDIMRAVNRGETDSALRTIDHSHALLQRDRQTLDAVETAVATLTGTQSPPQSWKAVPISVLAHRLDVRPATLRKWERAGILQPTRDPATRYRVYSPDDVRDAELAHLLRRGGHRLDHISAVLSRVRDAGGTEPLAVSLRQWRAHLTRRGRAMLTGAARLAEYLDADTDPPH
ncbi:MULTISPECIES: MerR family transcriptional regulator [unclassified Micromonospora]|uniref:MerR family transcriptional regulator n=1 Tax=unclassified Micromonospora TaxID=2617518 RepID=UPI0022B64758|nr:MULTISPECIES: MerR family transcriptional regulator [unclassified Micromonospora]MCZ7423652.1 MerR family DNA-binding transcriptional regulator [Verrucosispora sp. WMMA2121]WBB91341.1 MerR family DNA-binding transcriptional regulator [Verrucosispora sp. WMMC514]